MSNHKDVVELLSCTSTVSDAWTELYRSLNVRDLILKITPDSSSVLRMVGPFMSAERMFVPFTNDTTFWSNIDIMAMVKEKDSVILSKKIQELKSKIVGEVRKNPRQLFTPKTIEENNGFTSTKRSDGEIFNLIPAMVFTEMQNRQLRSGTGWVRDPLSIDRSRFDTGLQYAGRQDMGGQDRFDKLNQLKSLIDFIRILGGNKNWQDCLLVNVVVSPSRQSQGQIRILPLFRSIIDGLMLECRRMNRDRPAAIKINGLKAYDITITRQGMGPLNSNFRVTLSPDCGYLSKNNMGMIFTEGLIDIPAFVEKLNEKSSNGSYFYRVKSPYKMPEEFYSTLYDEYDQMVEKLHVDKVDEDIAELPSEAFENMQDINNPIASLEV
jgi:hypothetical protein